MSGTRRPKADHTSTRIISHRTTTVDGVPFRWWAVGEHPALVTVRANVFGTLAEFTYADAEQFAATLAQKLLAQHYARAGRDTREKPVQAKTSALKRPGWFNPGDDATPSS